MFFQGALSALLRNFLASIAMFGAQLAVFLELLSDMMIVVVVEVRCTANDKKEGSSQITSGMQFGLLPTKEIFAKLGLLAKRPFF